MTSLRNRYANEIAEEMAKNLGDFEMADEKCEKCNQCPCVCKDEEETDDELVMAADFTLTHLAELADTLDGNGFKKLADIIDETMLKISEKKNKTWKGKDEKPPKGAVHKAPKGWFDEMKKDVKKKNPDYSAKRINEIVGDIWDNKLTDKKREQIYKNYGKKKNPNR